MSKQVSLPKISSILQKMKIGQTLIYALFARRPSIMSLCKKQQRNCLKNWITDFITYLKQSVRSDWLIHHLVFAHGCMLMTYSITKLSKARALWCSSICCPTFWPLWWPVSLLTRVQTTLNHIRFVFYPNIKDNEMNICLDNWKHQLGLESARAALCKWAACTRQTFLSKTFTNLLNMQKHYKKCLGNE